MGFGLTNAGPESSLWAPMINRILPLAWTVLVFLVASCGSIQGAATALAAKPSRTVLPGQQVDGSVLLPNQWSLRPAGKQVRLGDFPVNIAIHPSGRFAAVLHCGYGQHEIMVIEIASGKLVSRVEVPEAFYGLVYTPDGSRLWCSGAGNELVHSFAFAEGYLHEHRQIQLREPKQRGIPSGLAISPDGNQMWVANVWGHRVSALNLVSNSVSIDLAIAAPTTNAPLNLVKPPENEDEAAAAKRDAARWQRLGASEPFPYACVFDAARKRLYVSLWGQSRVAVVDTETHAVQAFWPTQEHPNEMLLSASGKFLFVANANRNTVSVFDAATGATLETLFAALYPDVPPGSTPNSLALTPDDGLLFVANACNNNVAVFDVAKPGHSRSLGFIPVGWYPTSVRVTPDGSRLLVANGKGLISKANRHGPQPGKQDPPGTVREYIAGLLQGSLSIISLPVRDKFLAQMKDYTAQVYRCSPLRPDGERSLSRPPNNPIPARVGGKSPIKYCLYIIKENRTYDQVLGDMPQGNGDPGLCLFPEQITPNHHALAREFVLLDNFYVESEVSADGHEWTVGAYATDFVEKTWPMSYGHGSSGKFPYPAEGNFAIAMPAEGYLWERAKQAKISYRSYGEFVDNGKTAKDPATTAIAALIDHIDPWYRGWDLDYPDVKRAERFIAELHRFEQAGDMPRLQILRLPNDHTSGTGRTKLTPRAMVADNDQGLGMIVAALSRSKFWPQTAIFVVEDDAQNGPDHIDAHRTIAFAISPYTRRGKTDSTLYSTCSMLRTIELILGLKPLSQFDAAAMPMYQTFQARPNTAPYRLRSSNLDLQEHNLASAWGSQLSESMDFSKEDAADDLLLNEVVWRSVRGAANPMPAPVRAAFVFSSADADDRD